MEIKLTLALPRDELSVPVVRRVLKQAMGTLGVERECIGDVELALTEACSNVLNHAVDAEEYEVSAGIDGSTCVIEVVDRGAGFDSTTLGHSDAEHSAEGGRGIQIMRALVDRVEFQSSQPAGTVVRLEKHLQWREESVIRALSEGKDPTKHGPWSQDDGAPQTA
ncbi:MAG: ATP-binding protein [Actinomycetes bacterium]